MANKPKNDVCVLSEDQKKAVEALKVKITGLQHIHNINTDDDYILRFLYSTDFNVVHAFARMKNYHQNMLEHPNWYTKDSPLKRKQLLDTNMSAMVPPPACDKDGRLMYVLKLGNIDIQNTTILDEAAVDDIWIEYMLDKHPEISGKGICMILDFEGVTWKYIKWLNLEHIKIAFKKLSSLPFKEYKVHIVNNSRCVKYLIKFIMHFIPEESKQQIYFHRDDWYSLYEHIDKDYVLPEHGGYNKLNYRKINEKLYEKNDQIEKNFLLYRSVTKR